MLLPTESVKTTYSLFRDFARDQVAIPVLRESDAEQAIVDGTTQGFVGGFLTTSIVGSSIRLHTCRSEAPANVFPAAIRKARVGLFTASPIFGESTVPAQRRHFAEELR